MDKKFFELTNPQKSIWYTEGFYKGTPIENITGTVLIDGKVNFKLLEQAINIFVQKNDSFRLKFIVKDNKIVQYLDKYTKFPVEIIPVNSDDDLKIKEKEIAESVFGTMDSLLFNFKIVKLKNEHGGFIINMHHLISDAWSAALGATGIIEIYTRLLKNESIEDIEYPSYIEYITSEQEYMKSDKFEKDKKFWNDLFEVVPEVATIPSVLNTKEKKLDSASNRKQFTISKDIIEKINKFCKENKVSAFNFFMGIFAVYIGRVSNLDEFAIGSPILNRKNVKEKHTSGMFINTIPLKVNLSNNISFINLASSIGTSLFNMFKHQKYPYLSLLEDLRSKDNTIPNLYNILISYQNTRSSAQTSETPYCIKWDPNGHTSDDIDIHIYDMNDTGNINIAYDYKLSKYTEENITDIHERILNLIDQVLTNNEILVNNLEIVTPEEKQKLIYDFNNTKVDYPKYKTISELFEEQVERTPDNIALVFEDKKMTYKELNEKANSLAWYLKNIGIVNNNAVGIFLDKSLESIIAMLAILKCGAVYLPIDTDYPDNRIEFMIKDSSCAIILSSLKFKDKLNKYPNTLYIDLSNTNIYSDTKTFSNKNITSDDLAYIMYTSGSTGNPKGVMVSNKNIVRLVKNTNFIKFQNTERMLQTGSIVFDACTFEIWGALLNGFELYIIKKSDLLDPTLLEAYLVNNKITILWLTAPLFNQLCENNPSMFKTIRVLLTGGDILSPKHINSVKKACPNLTIINGYGPTENTTFSTCFTIDKFYENSIPIGFPIANSTCFVVSPNLSLLPVGVPGELLVGGDGVSKGYLNNNNFTLEKFITNPFGEGILYRTGDLVKWLPNGSIDFIGRVDNLVKIRGFRIELNEITLRVQEFANIKECITIVKNINNEKVICSYFSSIDKIDTDNLKNWLVSCLPHYAIPTYLIQLPSLPINVNGKVDIKNLPEPQILNSKSKIVLPRNDIDSKLINILKDILSINEISLDDNFFELGGDSLSAINLCTQIQNEFNVLIFVKDILEKPIIMDLSDFIITKLDKDNICKIAKAPKTTCYPLSSAQKRIYLTSTMSGKDSILYNIPGGVILDKMPDIDKLEKCLNLLIKRHESLRTYFEIVDNNIVQKIQPNIAFKLDTLNNSLSYENLEQEFYNFVKPFDLSQAPLFRAKFLNLEDNKVALFLDMHHIISDGTSLNIFINELCKLYNNETLNELNISYKDFAVWENNKLSSGKFKEAEEFWLSQFKTDIPALNMPTNFPRSMVKSYDGNKFYFKFNEETTSKINTLCKKLEVTPYMFLLSVYYILLHKYTSQSDIIVGTPIVGRSIADLYNIIGMFVNTLPMRTTVDANTSFKSFLKDIKKICLDNYKYQDYPLDELVNKLNIKRDASRNPLFDVMFIYQNNGNTSINFDKINSEYFIPDTKISKFDLSLEIIPQDNELNLSFEYSVKLFNESYLENLSNHYSNILNIVLDNFDIKLSDIDMLSDNEKQKLIYDFNNTKVDYPKDKTISELFEEQVERTPDNIALVFEDKKMTYKELNEKANSLAWYLRSKNIGRNDIVGIMVNRSLEMIIAILAVLKSGGTYIPIDPEYPQDRVEYMLENSHAKLLLTFESLKDKVIFENKIFVELKNKQIYSFDKTNLDNINKPNDASYIIYTSGSTGKPKGVCLTHKALSNLTNYCNNYVEYLKDGTYRTIVSITTICFDIFIFETLISLQKGLKLVIANEDEKNVPSILNNLIKKHDITIIQSTPSRMQFLVENLNDIPSLNKLKFITLAGEQLPINLVKQLKDISDIKIYNGYGPSETTVFSTLTDVTDYETITIGKPLYNTQIYIVNENLNLLPIGCTGELYIAGDGLGKGYLNNLELTNKSFINNPFEHNTLMYKTGDLGYFTPNGEIMCLGRCDNQVKIRGLRIELEEIETHISTYPDIEKSVVVVNNEQKIIAYFTSNKTINTNDLKAFLQRKLPSYFIPNAFMQVDKFKMTPNGKIDRKALSKVKIDVVTEYEAPKTEYQKQLVKIFESVLGNKKIGINDNFFEIGGDSLSAIKLQIEAFNQGLDLSYKDIFTYPTIKLLAQNVIKSTENITKEVYDYTEINKLLSSNINAGKPRMKKDNIKNILLTGATGYLGSHILDYLLKNTKSNIYCLIRAKNNTDPQTRLLDTLRFYFGNKYDKLVFKRIFAVEGNISKNKLGLNSLYYNELGNNINCVINSAAIVKHYGNSKLFNDTNITGTQNIIDFCNKFNSKLIHLSTLSVSGNIFNVNTYKSENLVHFSEKNLYINQDLSNIYINTKFIAERLILENILNNNLNAKIIRVGNITNRYSDGAFQINISENAFLNRIHSFIQIGYAPNSLKNTPIEFTPVDICANAIVNIAKYDNPFTVFHVFNNNFITFEKLVKTLKSLNITLEFIEDNIFNKKIKELSKNDATKHVLSGIINDFSKNKKLEYVTNIKMENKFTNKYLRRILFQWPKINEKYIRKYVAYLKSIKYI